MDSLGCGPPPPNRPPSNRNSRSPSEQRIMRRNIALLIGVCLLVLSVLAASFAPSLSFFQDTTLSITPLLPIPYQAARVSILSAFSSLLGIFLRLCASEALPRCDALLTIFSLILITLSICFTGTFGIDMSAGGLSALNVSIFCLGIITCCYLILSFIFLSNRPDDSN